MYSMPRASWTVLRLIWMQVALCVAFLLERVLLHELKLFETYSLTYRAFFTEGEVWRAATAPLLHTDPFHLLFNLLALWMFGSELEQRWGRRTFLRFYALCAVASSLTFLALGAAFPVMQNDVFFGSTGSVLALLIAYAIYWPDRQVWFFFLFPVRMKYVALITGVIAILYALSSAPFILSSAGHVGGLAAGGLILLLTGGEPSKLNSPFERIQEAWQRSITKPKKNNANSAAASENLDAQIDVILDKISRGGMRSLSKAEKEFLRSASERMNRAK